MMNIVGNDPLTEQYNLEKTSAPEHAKELGQSEFLELMMAQLENQDPMKPMDNGEFLGQMAQFSTVTGIDKMQNSIEQLTNTYATGQTLQSAQLVGREVLIEDNSMELSKTGTTHGAYELENSSNEVLLNVMDMNGSVIRQIQLGERPPGRHAFSWDGLDDDGKRVPPGNYSAQVTIQQGEAFVNATVLTNRVIESVEFGTEGTTTLNTQQGSSLTLSDIREIRQSSNSNSQTQ